MTDDIYGQGENLIVAFRAPNEVTANIVKGLLTSEGIPAILESRQVPMYDGVFVAGEGFWGDVVVPSQYAERSRELIAAYQADVEVEDGDVAADEPGV